MTVAEIMKRMVDFAEGNHADINHFMKVWTFAKTIGELEGLDPEPQFILETAAITHDIACPLCRRKYGNTNGKYQELEGDPLVRDFLAGTGLTEEEVDRVAFLVGHHHTLQNIEGMDYQILIEADYLVNADESHYTEENIRNFAEKVFRTKSGRELLRAMYGI